MAEYVLIGTKEICLAVGRCPREFAELLREGLPAYQIKANGKWRLNVEDVQPFLREQRDRARKEGAPAIASE